MQNYRVYNFEDRKLIIVKDFKTIFIDSSSEPMVKHDEIIFISPFEFEEKGNIYIYDKQDLKKLPLNIPSDHSPKCLCWVDENRILLIIGRYHGTITLGGDLYLYNIVDSNLEKLKVFKKEIQITKIIKIDKNKFELLGNQYIDSDLNEHISYTEEFILDKEKE